MSKRIGIVWDYIAHYKYLIVIVLGILVVGFVDENSIRQRILYQIEIDGLRSEIEKYETRYQNDLKQLQEMRKGVEAYKKIARERYFMKANDEEIFVLSTDLPDNDKEQEDNETVE